MMSRRITLTLSDEEYALLEAAGKRYQQPIASLAGDTLVQALNDWEAARSEAAYMLSIVPVAGHA